MSRKRHKDLCKRWPPPTNSRLQKQPLTSCANILSLALWYSSSLSSIDLLLLSAFKRIRIWQGHTHAQVYFSSNSRDARLSRSYQHVRKISDSLFGGRKKKNTYRAVFTIKAGVVSFQNVAFLKIVRPVILDVLREFLIGAVGCGNSRGH